MTYKEALFFIGKCLTINHEDHNKKLIENDLKNNVVDWDAIVKVSTSHYVFPALYCNLKKADFLHYLPEDLVEYMKHITDLNRERNQQIIQQAKEINELLLANEITPIFLKGTGNLLEGLYDDIGERMVGDIDFIVSEESYENCIKICLEESYKDVIEADYHFPNPKHYNRLQKKDKIAAIEIHKQMLTEKYSTFFNYSTIVKHTLNLKSINLLSYKDQLKLTIMAFQLNDNGQHYNTINLRNAYDVFLLSKKTNSLKDISTLDKTIKNALNNFLILANKTMNAPSIAFETNKDSEKYYLKYIRLITNSKLGKRHKKHISKKIFLHSRLSIIFKAFYKKDYTIWLFNRLTKGRVTI